MRFLGHKKLQRTFQVPTLTNFYENAHAFWRVPDVISLHQCRIYQARGPWQALLKGPGGGEVGLFCERAIVK